MSSPANHAARRATQPIARSVAAFPIGGAAAWNPLTHASAIQVMPSYSYNASTVGGLPALTSSIGTLAQPRGQRCVLFDGTNDYAIAATAILTGSGDFTLCAWITATNSGASRTITGNYEAANTSGIQFSITATNKLRVYLTTPLDSATTLVSGTTYHVAVTRVSGLCKLYINGVEDASGTRTTTIGGVTEWVVGSLKNSGERFNGKTWEHRVYSVGKSAAEVLAIYNQHLTPTTIDRTGLLAGWWLNDEAGTVHRDWSGNGKDLTITNAATPTPYHSTDTGVKFNAANELGHSNVGNLSLYSEDFTQINSGINSGNTATATNVTFSASGGYRYKAINAASLLINGDSIRGTLKVKSADGKGKIGIAIYDGSNFNYQSVTLTSTYQTITIECKVVSNANIQIGLDNRTAFGGDGTTTGSIDVINWQLYNINSGETRGYIQTTTTEVTNRIIPRNEAIPAQDAAGNALGLAGPIMLPAVVEVPCITIAGNATLTPTTPIALGTSHTLAFTGILGSSSIVFGSAAIGYAFYCDGSNIFYASAPGVFVQVAWVADGLNHHFAVIRNGTSVSFYIDGVQQGTTQTLGSNGAWTLTRLSGYDDGTFRLNGRLSNVRIWLSVKTIAEVTADDRTGITASWRLQDGGGTSNTNRTCYDDSGNGNHLTVVSGTVSAQWANRTNKVKDYCIENGGGISANGAYVAGIPGSANDAAGNVKTLAVGSRNPYSRMNNNYWSAPSLVNIAALTSWPSVPYITGNGTNVFVNCGNVTAFNSATKFTIWGVGKIASTTQNGIFQKRVSSTNAVQMTLWSDGHVYIDVLNGLSTTYAYWLYTGVIQAGVDFTWCVVFDGTLSGNANRLKLYIDGTQRTLTFSGTIPASTGDFAAANLELLKYNGASFGNRIGNVITSTLALSAAEVAALPNTLPANYTLFPCSDGSGADIAKYTDGVYSLLSSAIQGTLTGVWANKTDGTYTPSMNTVEAIVPRDTKFQDAEDYQSFRVALTGSDKTNAEAY